MCFAGNQSEIAIALRTHSLQAFFGAIFRLENKNRVSKSKMNSNLQNVWERLPKNWHLLHWPLFLFCQFVLVSFSALNCYNRWPRNPLFTKFEKNSAKFNFSKKLVKLCLHFIKIVRVLDDLTNFFSISKKLQFLCYMFWLRFSAKIQISDLPSSLEKSNFWTKIKLVPQCAWEEVERKMFSSFC